MKKINLESLSSLLSGYWLSDLPNFASYIYTNMEDLNWVGFYLNDGKTLRLGPFMGEPACLLIPYNKGVCGKSYSANKSLIVDDVHSFAGHITCDSRSQSEMVIPFYINQELVGVLDLDSPSLARFTESDRELIEEAVRILSNKISHYPDASFGKIHLEN